MEETKDAKAGEDGTGMSQQDERQGEEEKEVEETNQASHGNGKDSAVSSTINVDNEGPVSEANVA